MRAHIKLNYSAVYNSIVQGGVLPIEIGTRVSTLISIIETIPSNARIIIFSEFAMVLEICKNAIVCAQQTGKIVERKLYKICGTANAEKRNEAFDEFGLDIEPDKAKHETGAILLTVHEIGGIGLNLTGCHYAIFVEPLYNPQAERQAVNRM